MSAHSLLIKLRHGVTNVSLFFQIVYTEGALIQVKVHAEVLDILTGSRATTNDFYFAFDSGQPDLPRVVPRTYAGKCSL